MASTTTSDRFKKDWLNLGRPKQVRVAANLSDGQRVSAGDNPDAGMLSRGITGPVGSDVYDTKLATSSPPPNTSETTPHTAQSNSLVPPSNVEVTQSNAGLTSDDDLAQVTREALEAGAIDDVLPDLQLGPGIDMRNASQKMTDVMRTNPTPNSVWKRLLYGAVQGASLVNGQDTIGSALGKLIGGSAARSIPKVDSAQQKIASVNKAEDIYKVERQGELDADRDADREERATDRRERRALQTQTAVQRAQASVDAAKAKTDAQTQREIDNELKILEKTNPANTKDREASAKRLREKFGVQVSSDYGTKPVADKQSRERTLYDEQSGQYIKTDETGNPIKDAKGNVMVVRPGQSTDIKQSASEQKAGAESAEPPVDYGKVRRDVMADYRKNNPKDGAKSDKQLLTDPAISKYLEKAYSDATKNAEEQRRQRVNTRLGERKATGRGRARVSPTPDAKKNADSFWE